MTRDDGKAPLVQEKSANDKGGPKSPKPSASPKAKDYDKLSKALRENLMKRKSQQRLRDAPKED